MPNNVKLPMRNWSSEELGWQPGVLVRTAKGFFRAGERVDAWRFTNRAVAALVERDVRTILLRAIDNLIEDDCLPSQVAWDDFERDVRRTAWAHWQPWLVSPQMAGLCLVAKRRRGRRGRSGDALAG